MAQVGDLYEARIVVTQGQQTSINVRHYEVTAKSGNGATDAQIASAIDTLIAGAYKALLDSVAFYRGVGVRRITPLPIGVEVSTLASSGVGTATGDSLPGQVSGLITLRTAFGGRSRRGRVYIPFPAEGDNGTTGTPTVGYNTRLGTLAAQLITSITAGGGGNDNFLIPVVYSRKFNLKTPVTTASGPFKWATQRSRGTYGRVNAPPF